MADANEWNFSYTWRIERFSLFNTEEMKCICSPRLTIAAFGNGKLSLAMRASAEELSFHLYKTWAFSESIEDIFVSSEIQIMIRNGEISRTWKDKAMYINGNEYLLNSVAREELLEEMKKSRSDTLTVFCSMRKGKNGVTPLIQKFEAMTKFSVDQCCLEWRLKLHESSHSVSGRKYFSIGDMFYKMEAETDQEYVTISMHSLLKNSFTIFVLGKVTLLDVAGNKLASHEKVHSFKSGKKTCCFYHFLTKEYMQEKSKEIVKDGEIVLQCELRLRYEQKVTVPKTETNTCSNIGNILSVIDDFRKLLSNKNHSDVMLKSENKVMEAHRCVLAARSPVFSAMFDINMLESRTGNVDVKDVDEDTLESFLTFLYTGEMEDLEWEMACKLLLMAEKYQVSTLKEECCRSLITNISVENVCKVLEIADLVQHETLKNSCMDYIADHSNDLFQSLEWQGMVEKNGKLTSEIFLHMTSTIKRLGKK